MTTEKYDLIISGGTIAGPDGSRMPSEHEKKVAVHHGEQFGKIVVKLAK